MTARLAVFSSCNSHGLHSYEEIVAEIHSSSNGCNTGYKSQYKPIEEPVLCLTIDVKTGGWKQNGGNLVTVLETFVTHVVEI